MFRILAFNLTCLMGISDIMVSSNCDGRAFFNGINVYFCFVDWKNFFSLRFAHMTSFIPNVCLSYCRLELWEIRLFACLILSFTYNLSNLSLYSVMNHIFHQRMKSRKRHAGLLFEPLYHFFHICFEYDDQTVSIAT